MVRPNKMNFGTCKRKSGTPWEGETVAMEKKPVKRKRGKRERNKKLGILPEEFSPFPHYGKNAEIGEKKRVNGRKGTTCVGERKGRGIAAGRIESINHLLV